MARAISLALASLIVFTAPGSADTITTVNQQNLAQGSNVSSTTLYQTFTPTLTGIDAAEFSLRKAAVSPVSVF